MTREREGRYPTNRERLMDAAGSLFYREGLHAITADRVAEEAAHRHAIELPEPIRHLGVHTVRIPLHAEVDATVTVEVSAAS